MEQDLRARNGIEGETHGIEGETRTAEIAHDRHVVHTLSLHTQQAPTFCIRPLLLVKGVCDTALERRWISTDVDTAWGDTVAK